jgi:hypothetical protein
VLNKGHERQPQHQRTQADEDKFLIGLQSAFIDSRATKQTKRADYSQFAPVRLARHARGLMAIMRPPLTLI